LPGPCGVRPCSGSMAAGNIGCSQSMSTTLPWRLIAREIGSPALIVAMPPMLAYHAIRVLGWIVGDVINTRDEVRGLMQEKLYVQSPPLGTTKLSDWVRASRQDIGRRYAGELQRRLGRDSTYRRR
jgi:hypothetical protein